MANGWSFRQVSGGSTPSFSTISVPSGTSPVATGPTDTLTLVAGSGISIVGNALTDTITITATGGGSIVDTSTFASPTTVAGSGNVSVPSDVRARKFIKSTSGAVTGVTLSNGSGTNELYLVGCSDTDTVQMVGASNLKLTGTMVFRAHCTLYLIWDPGQTLWREVSRSEF